MQTTYQELRIAFANMDRDLGPEEKDKFRRDTVKGVADSTIMIMAMDLSDQFKGMGLDTALEVLASIGIKMCEEEYYEGRRHAK